MKLGRDGWFGVQIHTVFKSGFHLSHDFSEDLPDKPLVRVPMQVQETEIFILIERVELYSTVHTTVCLLPIKREKVENFRVILRMCSEMRMGCVCTVWKLDEHLQR